MLEEFVLHIGTHKTGTTSVQRALEMEATTLESQSVVYPVSDSAPAGHPELAWALRPNHPRQNSGQTAESIVGNFLRQVEEAKCDRLLVSSEEFWLLPEVSIQRLKQLVPAKKYRIVAFFRRQDAYLQATFNQHVRQYETRESGTLFEFFVKYRYYNWLNYNVIIHRWMKVFGLKAMSVRTYDAAIQDENGFLSNCFGLMGVEVDAKNSNGENRFKWQNKSLGAVTLSALSRLNGFNDLSQTEHLAVLNECTKIDTEFQNHRYSLLTLNERRALVETFSAGNGRMLEKLGAGGDQTAWRWNQDEEAKVLQPAPDDLSIVFDRLRRRFPKLKFDGPGPRQ